MICYAYVAMHDCGRELPNNRMGVLLGVFSDDSEATLWMAQHGFSELDSFGDFWKGRDRGWITEMHVDNPTEDATM